MRKMFFSFLATLAFGSFAMANNVELLPVEVETFEAVNVETFEIEIFEYSKEEVGLNVDCIEHAYAAGAFAESMGLNDDQQFLFMQQAHRQCSCQHYNQCYYGPYLN
jgi:hypothetical protein